MKPIKTLLTLLALSCFCFGQSTDKDTTNTYGERIDSPAERTAFLTALGIELINNTSDLSKPVSTLTQAQLDLKLIASLNLSDLANVSTARTNLGLGTLATQSGTFSGTSSGSNTGDNAVNTLYSGLVTNATHTGDATGSGALSVVKIQGTPIAAPVAGDDGKIIKYNHGTTSFVYEALAGGGDLLSSNNLSDLANAATARTNLGLGTMAVETAANYPTLTSTSTLTNKTLTNPTVTNFVESVVAIGSTGTSKTIALTSGTVQTATLTGNCTFTMPTATAGKSFTVLLKTGTGSFTSTFTGVKWSGGTVPTITTTASKMDIVSFIADGTNWYGTIVQNFTP